MRRQQLSAVIAALVVAVTAPVLTTVTASPAQASAYRFWSYWQVGSAGWQFAKVGATGSHPDDGAVQGWRFAVSPGTASAPAPRIAASTAFASVCGDTAPQSGKKRVALVVDFGVKAHAPSGQSPPDDALRGTCVVIRPAATGWDILVAADYAIRSESSMVCGLAGYPTSGCGVVVADPPPSKPTPPPAAGSGSGGSAGNDTSSGAKGSGRGDTTARPTAKRTSTATAAATTPASPRTTASPSASALPSGSAAANAIPSAEPLDSSSALPSLVSGAPAASTDGSSSSPLLAGLALLVIAGIAVAAFLRTRARRSA